MLESQNPNLQQLSYTEPQDEYVCIRCRNSVGLVINGMCFKCSNELDNQDTKQ